MWKDNVSHSQRTITVSLVKQNREIILSQEKAEPECSEPELCDIVTSPG